MAAIAGSVAGPSTFVRPRQVQSFGDKVASIDAKFRSGGGLKGDGSDPLGVTTRDAIPILRKSSDVRRFYPRNERSTHFFLLYMAVCMASADNTRAIQSIMASAGGVLANVPKTAASMNLSDTGTAIDVYDVTTNSWVSENVDDGNGVTYSMVTKPANFYPEVAVTDIDQYLTASSEELGALFAVYYYALGKTPNGNNVDAFNLKRRKAVSALCATELMLFTDDSPFITVEILNRTSKAFSVATHVRAGILLGIVRHFRTATLNASYVFQRIFALNSGSGLSLIHMTQLVARKVPRFLEHFPELKGDVVALYNGIESLERLDMDIRDYAKYIYGAEYVPINPEQVKDLFAVVKQMAAFFEETYKEFGGNEPPAYLKRKVDTLLNSFRENPDEFTAEEVLMDD